MNDNVKSPNHYTWLKGIECIQVTKHFNFILGNAIKYIWRSQQPGRNREKVLEDLLKAREYLEIEIHELRLVESTKEEQKLCWRFREADIMTPFGTTHNKKVESITISNNEKNCIKCIHCKGISNFNQFDCYEIPGEIIKLPLDKSADIAKNCDDYEEEFKQTNYKEN